MMLFSMVSWNFETRNVIYKVLGIEWNSLDDFLYYDSCELATLASKLIDWKRHILKYLGSRICYNCILGVLRHAQERHYNKRSTFALEWLV